MNWAEDLPSSRASIWGQKFFSIYRIREVGIEKDERKHTEVWAIEVCFHKIYDYY